MLSPSQSTDSTEHMVIKRSMFFQGSKSFSKIKIMVSATKDLSTSEPQ